MRPTSKTYETRLPSSRNQRANLDVSGRVEATMSSSVFSDWLCKTRPRKNKHMTHVTVCCSNFNAQNHWSFLLLRYFNGEQNWSFLLFEAHAWWDEAIISNCNPAHAIFKLKRL